MPESTHPLLSALFAPHPAQWFLRDYWPARPLQVHGPRERLPATLRHPMLASATELAQRYQGPLRFTHGHSDRLVFLQQGGDAVGLLDMGLTVNFVGLANVLPDAQPFLRQLERELGLLSNTMVMIAFASSGDDGLVCHFDNSDLISVQLAGSKRFHYSTEPAVPGNTYGQYIPGTAPFDELYAMAGDGFPDPAKARFEVAEMKPGSVLFLPRGTWHHTEGEGSLSVSLLADAHNAMRCVLDQLRFLLLQDPRWRRPLVCGFGDDARDAQTRAQVAELLGALPEVMRHLSPDDVLGARTLVGLRPQTVSPASRFLRAPHTRVEIGAPGAGGAVLVKFVAAVTRRLGRTVRGVEMTPGGVSLLRWIEAREAAFAAGDLAAAFPDQPFAAVKQVLELCVQAQFVRLLWFPALRC